MHPKGLILFVIVACISSAYSQVSKEEEQRFSYHISGTVFDELLHPMTQIPFVSCRRYVRITVDHVPRPTTMETYIPDLYRVAATTGRDVGIITQRDKVDRREVFSDVAFGDKDEFRRLTLQFDSIEKTKATDRLVIARPLTMGCTNSL